VSGAAPAWAAMIDALATGAPKSMDGPPPPPGIVAQAVRFEHDREPPRTEWFMSGTQSAMVSVAAPDFARPVITRPLDGEVFALDPEIPPSRQQVLLESTAHPDGPPLEWRVDGKRLAGVGESTVRWPLAAGVHVITLVRPADGQMVDAVRVTVRGLATKVPPPDLAASR
jgi:penicillin-binding protein 1C